MWGKWWDKHAVALYNGVAEVLHLAQGVVGYGVVVNRIVYDLRQLYRDAWTYDAAPGQYQYQDAAK